MISFKKAKEIHEQSIIKNNSSESFFSVFIFRKISILVSWVLASLNIHPNIISTAAFLSSIFGGVLLLVDFHVYKIIAIILIMIGFVLDMSDGEVARMTNKQSAFGGFYDPFLDMIRDIALPLLIGIGFWLCLKEKSLFFLLLVIFCATISFCLFYLMQVEHNLGLEQPIETIRKNAFIGIPLLKKYVKWDGGFTVILYLATIYFELLTFLFIFLSFFLGIIVAMSFGRIYKKLNN